MEKSCSFYLADLIVFAFQLWNNFNQINLQSNFQCLVCLFLLFVKKKIKNETQYLWPITRVFVLSLLNFFFFLPGPNVRNDSSLQESRLVSASKVTGINSQTKSETSRPEEQHCLCYFIFSLSHGNGLCVLRVVGTSLRDHHSVTAGLNCTQSFLLLF